MTDSLPPIRTIGVLGAGTMGHGIAQVAAAGGFEVVLRDLNNELVARGRQAIERNLAKGIERGKITEEQKQKVLSRITTTSELRELAAANLIIEAAPENLDLKRNLLRECEEVMQADCIWATNTSSLSITEIAGAAARPHKVIGMHFFNPVHIMRLVEIVIGRQTSDETTAVVREVGRQMKKEPIVVRDVPGFASSRLGVTLGLEAMRMVEQGVASARDIDTAMELGYNHPMGPLRLSDLIGLDTIKAIAESMYEEFKEPLYSPPPLLLRMVDAGLLGKKSGRGFYSYA